MRHDNAKRIFFFFSCSRCLLPFFLDFSATWILPDEHNICWKKKRPTSDWVCIAIKENRAKCCFPPLKTKVKKWFPCRANYSLGFSKSPIHCCSTLAGASFNSLVRLAEQNKCHGRLPLVDAIMSTCLVSKYSAYWPDIWAEYNLNRFYDRKLKSLRNNASARNTNNRVFAKVRFRNLLSKIVPKVRFAVIFCIKGKNVLHRR